MQLSYQLPALATLRLLHSDHKSPHKSKSHRILELLGRRHANTKPCSAPYKLPRVLLQADARLTQNEIPNLDKGVST